jgi:hypothetical protein
MEAGGQCRRREMTQTEKAPSAEGSRHIFSKDINPSDF